MIKIKNNLQICLHIVIELQIWTQLPHRECPEGYTRASVDEWDQLRSHYPYSVPLPRLIQAAGTAAGTTAAGAGGPATAPASVSTDTAVHQPIS